MNTPLLIGQLKAIADPFYTRLDAASPHWLESERTTNGTAQPGSIFPWTSAVSDDKNKGVANIGQLKALFSLRFEHDADIDGMPGLWEEAYGLDQDDPTDADTDLDDDGLTNLQEYGNGTDPAIPDTDDDGTTDGDEVLQGSDPNNPNDKPISEWLILSGDLGAGEEKSRSRTVTIPKGESRLLIVALHSQEYPGYTEQFSDFDDILGWDIRPQGKDAVTGEVHVNDRHTDWELAVVDGVEILGFSPAHIETTAKYSAPGDADLVIEIDLTATNISDGSLPSTVMVGLLPVEVKENTDNPHGIVETGVDAVSKTAVAGDIGYVEDFWIMAPLGGAEYSNKTLFRIGMGANDTGELACANGTPTPAHLALDNIEKTINWRGAGTGVDSEEPVKTSINGSGESFPLPVKVKAMKYRTVNLRVYFAGRSRENDTPILPDPALKPTEAELEERLNQLFAYQMNTWFDVSFAESTEEVDWGGDFTYTGDPDEHSDDQNAEIKAHCGEGGLDSGNYDMHLFLLGHDGLLVRDDMGNSAKAVATPGLNTAWVLVRPVMQSKQVVLETIGHEIGHIFFGAGHPDAPNPDDRGVAPLVGTVHNKRLMYSANTAESRLIVKKEWDKAEEWLKNNPDEREENQ